jgi:hypothetical protein
MKTLGIGIGLSLALALRAVTATAGAGVLTGTYEGKASCSGIVAGLPFREKLQLQGSSAVLVTDLGTGRIALHYPGLPQFLVFVEPVSGIPVDGFSALGGINCPLDLVALQGATWTGTAREKGGTVKVKALLVELDEAGGQTTICKVSLKRVDTADPGAVGCN